MKEENPQRIVTHRGEANTPISVSSVVIELIVTIIIIISTLLKVMRAFPRSPPPSSPPSFVLSSALLSNPLHLNEAQSFRSKTDK